MKAVGGKGFFFSEGEKWKNKRKVMSKIFNFDFITSQVPIISKIFDKLFTNTEESYWRLHPRQA
jgi:cytochrome P450